MGSGGRFGAHEEIVFDSCDDHTPTTPPPLTSPPTPLPQTFSPTTVSPTTLPPTTQSPTTEPPVIPPSNDPNARCRDTSPDWHDSGGSVYNCAWYGQRMDNGLNRCETDGNSHRYNQYVAREACCVCGGGTNLPPSQCTDVANWYDVDGPYYDCEWYSHGSRCTQFGNDHSRMGQTAQTACCVCRQ